MIDLRNAKPGDKLISKHGTVLYYVSYNPDTYWPHKVRYADATKGEGTRADDGSVFYNNRMDSDEDIVEIIPQ
jgi:hypothetical protein